MSDETREPDVMGTKMTTGPWDVQQYRNHIGFSVWAPGRGCIAERWYDNEQAPPYGDEILANARAIASVPELLEALQECLPYVPGWTQRDFAGRPWLRKASEALEKAGIAL